MLRESFCNLLELIGEFIPGGTGSFLSWGEPELPEILRKERKEDDADRSM